MNDKLRMNIRNAYLAESVEACRAEAKEREAQGRFFEAWCLLELAWEKHDESEEDGKANGKRIQ